MTDLNMHPETPNDNEISSEKKPCRVKTFFTSEAKEGQRVLNWKFGVLIAVVLVIAFII